MLGFYAFVIFFTAILHYAVAVRSGWQGSVLWSSSEIVVAGLLATLIGIRARWTTWEDAGWPSPRSGVRGFGLGLCVGVAMAAAAIVLEITLGQGAVLLRKGSIADYLAGVLTLSAVLALAALSEEILFRGFPLTRLSTVIGRPGASLLLATGFTALHMANPDVTILGLVNIFLASVLLSAIFFRFGGLPGAWGAHFGWNAGLAVTDAPVSGISFDLPGIDFSTGGTGWIGGGHFGPEGGILTTMVMGVTLVLVGRRVFANDLEAPGGRGQEAGGRG